MSSNRLDQSQALDASIAEEVERIVEQCRPLFAGHNPAAQGAALADLTAIFIAGHHPDLREQVLEVHIAGVRGLVQCNELPEAPWNADSDA